MLPLNRVSCSRDFQKTVVAQFDQDHASSDGGAVLLKAYDKGLGLSASLAACLSDNRQPGKVKHSLQELFQQRMFGIACGYADANDAASLAHNPVFKLLIGRDAVDGHELASQPTLSRFENTVRPRDLLRMSEALTDAVINRHKRRKKKVKLITIDLDPTDDLAHGHQQFSLFNGFYDSNCYLPLAGFLSCSSFLANQLRVLMTAAAYVLFQELRLKARHTRFGRAQVSTIRLHLLKFGAWVESSVRRIVLHLSISTPFVNEWVCIARTVGTVPT